MVSAVLTAILILGSAAAQATSQRLNVSCPTESPRVVEGIQQNAVYRASIDAVGQLALTDATPLALKKSIQEIRSELLIQSPKEDKELFRRNTLSLFCKRVKDATRSSRRERAKAYSAVEEAFAQADSPVVIDPIFAGYESRPLIDVKSVNDLTIGEAEIPRGRSLIGDAAEVKGVRIGRIRVQEQEVADLSEKQGSETTNAVLIARAKRLASEEHDLSYHYRLKELDALTSIDWRDAQASSEGLQTLRWAYLNANLDARKVFGLQYQERSSLLRDDLWSRLPFASRNQEMNSAYRRVLNLDQITALASDLERLAKLLQERQDGSSATSRPLWR